MIGIRQTAVAAVAVTALASLALGGPALASHEQTSPWAPGCVQAVDAPLSGALYFDSSAGSVTVGQRCLYRSTVVGGYRVPIGGSWRVIIDRPDGSRVVYASALGSPSCGDAVIWPGDWVEVASTNAIAAGDGIGCS